MLTMLILTSSLENQQVNMINLNIQLGKVERVVENVTLQV